MSGHLSTLSPAFYCMIEHMSAWVTIWMDDNSVATFFQSACLGCAFVCCFLLFHATFPPNDLPAAGTQGIVAAKGVACRRLTTHVRAVCCGLLDQSAVHIYNFKTIQMNLYQFELENMMAKGNVLFLCTGNSARSQMAEAFLRHYGDNLFEVYSAGLEAKGMNPYTIRVMDEVGIDVRGQTSDNVSEIGGQRYYRYVITVCAHADQNCPTAVLALGREKLHWNFDDPAAATGSDAEIMAKFREVRDLIEAKVKAWLGELEAETA